MRRKWDVAAAPEPAPGSLAAQAAAAAEAALAAAAAPGHFAASRAGIGASAAPAQPAPVAAAPASGGVQVTMPAQPAAKVELPPDYQPGKPLDEETKRKIQASAAAVVQRLNQVRQGSVDGRVAWDWSASAVACTQCSLEG